MSNHAPILQHVAAKPLADADVRLSTLVTSIESTATNTQNTKVSWCLIEVSSSSTRLWLRFRWVA